MRIVHHSPERQRVGTRCCPRTDPDEDSEYNFNPGNNPQVRIGMPIWPLGARSLALGAKCAGERTGSRFGRRLQRFDP